MYWFDKFDQKWGTRSFHRLWSVSRLRRTRPSWHLSFRQIWICSERWRLCSNPGENPKTTTLSLQSYYPLTPSTCNDLQLCANLKLFITARRAVAWEYEDEWRLDMEIKPIWLYSCINDSCCEEYLIYILRKLYT